MIDSEDYLFSILHRQIFFILPTLFKTEIAEGINLLIFCVFKPKGSSGWSQANRAGILKIACNRKCAKER